PGPGPSAAEDPPRPLGPKQLDERAATAEPRPAHERQILHPAHADAAIARHALGLHEAVVGQRLALEFSEAGVLARLGLVPVDAVGCVVHECFSNLARPTLQVRTAAD